MRKFRGLGLKNHKAIGFHRNIGPDPLDNYKATQQEFRIGLSWVPVKGHSIFACGPIMARFSCLLGFLRYRPPLEVLGPPL